MATLVRRPADPDAWEALARAVVRSARLPAGLVRGLHLAPLLRRVATRGPGDGFLPLLLHLLDLRLAPEDEPLGAAWDASRRPRLAGGSRFDPETGLPLRVARRRGGVVMTLVGGGPRFPTGDGEPFYIDRAWVPGTEIARFAAEAGRRDYGRAYDGSANGTAEPDFAAAYAASQGARLVRAAEFAAACAGIRLVPAPMPDPDDELRAKAKARWRDGRVAALAAGAWGLVDPADPVWREADPGGMPVGIYLPELATRPADWTLPGGHWIRLVIPLAAREPALAGWTTAAAALASVAREG